MSSKLGIADSVRATAAIQNRRPSKNRPTAPSPRVLLLRGRWFAWANPGAGEARYALTDCYRRTGSIGEDDGCTRDGAQTQRALSRYGRHVSRVGLSRIADGHRRR